MQVDREKAGLSGVSVAEIARSVVAATSSSRFVVPNYWPDPKSGIGYQVQVEIPYQVMDSITEVETIPIQRPAPARSCCATSPRSAQGRCPASTTAIT